MPALKDCQIVPSGPLRVGLHYKLSAYICGSACCRRSPFEGWTTFAQIFQHRPDGCRYAVAQMVPLKLEGDLVVSHNAPAGEFLVWDLLDDRLTLGKALYSKGLISPPEPVWTGDSEDGLIMKAMALYER